MRRLSHAALAAALVVSTFAVVAPSFAVAPGDVTAELSPPAGQGAVKDGDRLSFGGEVPPDSTPDATLLAIGHDDGVTGTYDVAVSVDATGAVSGGITVGCFFVPGCDEAVTPAGQQAARDALAGYRLRLTVEDVSDTSAQVDYDITPPIILGYALTSPTTVFVRFSEDVTDPDGDAPTDWVVDGLRQVTSVAGVGNSRTLTFPLPQPSDATPEVRYHPTPSPDPAVPNVPYVDRARNELDADNRFSLAADEIPPPVPSIIQIEGRDVTYEDTDQAVPVLGNEANPTFTVDDVPEGVTTQVFLDADDDGVFEPDTDDVLIGEGVGDAGGQAEVVSDVALADGVHRFYAQSIDDADCDPNDPNSGTCPNASGRSAEARYDLDTIPPTPVGDALAHASTIVVQFSEPLVGANGAGQWTVTNPGGGAVTVEDVTGSGDTRTLQFSGGPIVDTPTPTLDWTAPGSDPHRDEHGNVLTGFPIDIAAAPLPLLTVESQDVVEGDPSDLPEVLDPPPTLDYTLRVSGLPLGETVEVAYETVPGAGSATDATPGDDYEADSGTVTITGTDGGSAETVVSVTVIRDLLDEFDESVFLQVSNVDDGAPQFTLPGDVATLTTAAAILDDDPPVVATISPASANVAEGGTIELTVQLDAVSGKPVTIDWATVVAADPAAGEAGIDDVPAQSGSVTIPAGQLSAPFQVEVADDETDEPDETFTVELSASDNANATLGDPSSATLTIIDDDQPLPTLSVEPGSVGEGDALLPALEGAQLPYTFRMSPAPEQAIEVGWTTTDAGTATSDADFVAESGRVRFEAGQTEQVLHIEVIDDELDEDDETAAINVVEPAGADLEGGGTEMTYLGTIIDDDPLPTVMYAGDSEEVVVSEGAAAEFTVELSTPALGSDVSGRDVSVDWETVFDGTADTGDLPAQSGTVVVPEGQTSATFEVTTTDDEEGNGDRTVTIELSSPVNAELGAPSRSTLTIVDDDTTLPTVTVTGGEGSEDPGLLPPLTSPSPVPFTVELSRTSDQDVTVRYRTTASGTATAESDFTGDSGTLTIAAGETSGTIEIEVLDDDLDEFDETVGLELSSAVNGRFPGDAATLAAEGTILDDDPPAVVSFGDDTSVDEGEGVVAEVSLDTPSGKPITVAWATVDQSADGSDYEQSSGTLEFDPGETTATITVQTFDDADVEGNEDFRIELSDPVNAELGDAEVVVTIIDNDEAMPGQNVLSMSSASVVEGDPVGPFPAAQEGDGLDFALTLQEPADGAVEVDYTATAGTADGTSPAGEGRDFEPEEGTVTIPGGERSATIEVVTYTDLLDEFDETVVVTITAVRGSATLPSAGLERTGRILDDDPPAELAFASDSVEVEVTEGGTAQLTVELDTASGKPVTVTWTTSYDGTADTDDVPPQRGQVTVAAGQTTATFDVDTADDDVREGTQDLSIVLSDPRNGRLSDGRPTTARLVLLDDELPVLSIVGGSVDEGAVGTLGGADPGLGLEAASAGSIRDADGGDDGGLVAAAVSPLEEDLPFTVTLDEAALQDVTVRWTTTDLGTATAGSDYVAESGTLTIPAGETAGEVLVDVLPDDLDEFDETVVVRFSEPDGAQFAGGAQVVEVAGTIIDDDPLVVADIGDDQEVTEGDPATFEVTLSEVSGKDVTLRYGTSDGSATAGQDYRAADDTLTIPAGDTSATFTIRTLDDATFEPTEDLSVQLSVVDEDTAELGRSTATLTITDDDLGVDPGDTVVSLSGDAVEEGDPVTPLPLPLGGNTLDFDVRLSEPADGDVVIDYTTRAGTATADDDFEPDSGQVTIPDGQEQATVSIGVVPDFLDEFDEDLQLVLTGVSGDAVIPGGELARTGRIIDDDPQARLNVSDATVLEGGTAELDVTLDNPSGKDITVAWGLVDGTATAGEDYVADSGTLSFPAGTTSRTVQVATLADEDAQELIEQFELVLSNATNAGIGDGRGTVSIVDVGADGLPTVTAVFLEDITTREGDSDHTALVPVRLSGASDQDTTVTWSSQELTATAGEDYRAEGGQVTIPAGETSAEIPVTIIADDEVEPNEDFLVLLTQAEGAVITGPTGRVTIEDDDADGAGDDDGPGGGDDPDGAPDGGDSGDGDAGQRQLPATGGGAGLLVFGLALLAARRRREHG